MKYPLVSGRPNGEASQQGFTLVEVMLAAAIIAMLAVFSTTALFYPRLLVVNSNLEQSAIHAGIAEIERHLYSTNSVPLGTFNTDGWNIQEADVVPTFTIIPEENLNGIIGDDCEYLQINVTVRYRGEKTVELVTYRSLQR